MWIKFLALLLISSCSIFFENKQPDSAKGAQYKINFKQDNWVETKQEEERSDYVWTNKNDGRILLSNSFCQEFQEQPLDVLAKKTFNIVDDFKVEKKDYITLENREAYRLEGKGKVDGVPVGLILVNTRRNNCYFDFVAITPLKSSKDEHADFEKFLKSVDFK
jgi:hypothetical protein